VENKAGRLGFVAGLIAQDKIHGFERLLFRATRCGAAWGRAVFVGQQAGAAASSSSSSSKL